MSVRRGAIRLVMVLTVVASAVAGVASPAAAAEDRVTMKLPGKFTTGGSPGVISATVTKRTDGCVQVRTALAVRLAGLPADQVRVQILDDDDWRTLSLSERSDGVIVTEGTAPERSTLCRRKSISVRYRLTFLAGSPGGQAVIGVQAHTAEGEVLAQAADSRPVVIGPGASPVPTDSPSPTPEPSESEEPPPTAAPTQSAAAAPEEGGFGLLTIVMIFGAVMVAIGATLLVVLVRRSKDGDKPDDDGYPPAPPPYSPRPRGGGDATMLLPKLPRR